MFKEFKEFVNQGNALDLAVGVLIGAAFGKIVNSHRERHHHADRCRIALGGVDFKNMYIPLEGQTADDARRGPQSGRRRCIAYGAFLQNVIEFFIVAFTIFLVVRQINKWRGTTPKKA